jgi:hypothetical protein
MSVQRKNAAASQEKLQSSGGDQHDQHERTQAAIDDAVRLYKKTGQAQERTEELRATLQELKQHLLETRAESRRHIRSLNSRLKRNGLISSFTITRKQSAS